MTVTLVQPLEQGEAMNPFFEETIKIIDEADAYALARGKMGGMDWGVQCFNDAFEGLNPGLHLVAGQANTGKSALCVQLAWNIAAHNRHVTADRPRKAFVLYISLDDTANEIIYRTIATDRKIPINAAKFPLKFEGDPNGTALLSRRTDGLRRLKDSAPYFRVIDMNSYPGCENIETIEQIVSNYNFQLKEIDEHYQLVVFIDNFHDISSETSFKSDDNAKYDYISKELDDICKKYDVPIVCTAELRKLNGNRRPTMDDVRQSVKIAYVAKAIILCYNEVGLRGEGAQIYWRREGSEEKQMILEARIGKNKFSSFKKQMYFEFDPDMSYLREATKEGAIRYSQMIMN